MSASPSITIFNANTLAVQISVNNGPQFSVAGVPASFIPQSPTSGNPTWSNNGPAQNVIGPGTNYLNITPTGSVNPYVTVLNIPQRPQFQSLQLYIFFNSYTDVSWIVLNDGDYVTGNLQLSTLAHHEKHAG